MVYSANLTGLDKLTIVSGNQLIDPSLYLTWKSQPLVVIKEVYVSELSSIVTLLSFFIDMLSSNQLAFHSLLFICSKMFSTILFVQFSSAHLSGNYNSYILESITGLALYFPMKLSLKHHVLVNINITRVITTKVWNILV